MQNANSVQANMQKFEANIIRHLDFVIEAIVIFLYYHPHHGKILIFNLKNKQSKPQKNLNINRLSKKGQSWNNAR